MPQTLPEGATILPLEYAKIVSAYQDLEKNGGANATLKVQVNLHIVHDYPKHVVVGERTFVVNSPEEEQRALNTPPPVVEPVLPTPAPAVPLPPVASLDVVAAEQADPNYVAPNTFASDGVNYAEPQKAAATKKWGKK